MSYIVVISKWAWCNSGSTLSNRTWFDRDPGSRPGVHISPSFSHAHTHPIIYMTPSLIYYVLSTSFSHLPTMCCVFFITLCIVIVL